jgi:TonB family protein
MRSTLPFILLALVLALRGEGQARQGGTWVVTDQPSITLELEALNVVQGAVVTFRPALYVRCLNERLEAFVATGAVREGNPDYRTTVRLYWANRPPLEETWSRSTDYAAVFAPDPAALIEQILATPELRFEFHADGAVPIIARFNGAGLATHLPRLRSKCAASAGRAAQPPVPAIPVSTGRVYAETEVDEKAEVRSLPDPEYPPLLRRAGVGGTVIVQLVIDTLGQVEPGSARVVSSPNPDFNRPALNAIEQSVFRPARIRGQAVRVRMRLQVRFKEDNR